MFTVYKVTILLTVSYGKNWGSRMYYLLPNIFWGATFSPGSRAYNCTTNPQQVIIKKFNRYSIKKSTVRINDTMSTLKYAKAYSTYGCL